MQSSYDKFPYIEISQSSELCFAGWTSVISEVQRFIHSKNQNKTVVCIDLYQGVDAAKMLGAIQANLQTAALFLTASCLKSASEIQDMVFPFVTDDPIFGKISNLEMIDFFNVSRLDQTKKQIKEMESGTVVIFGEGAALFADADVLIYADLARWEIQKRMKRNEAGNFGVDNQNGSFALKYKQGYFLDWRVFDRHKLAHFDQIDYFIDANDSDKPKMLGAELYQKGLTESIGRPFRVVPFFDPGPWGGQWLKEVVDLNRDEINYAWGFDCVPEENSLLFKIGEHFFELPAINLVLTRPKELLGEAVFNAFGAEFPIRFDFLDTMEGGNLSLQVHPTRTYIQEQFGMSYTQDESYYFLEAEKDACVYLGTHNDVDTAAMIADLEKAQQEMTGFDAEKYVNKLPVKKHDHILIPAGTIHCSGKNAVVLEISATPYIFTFKLWDWGRLGLDGKPRPINIEHGKNVIDFSRDENWVKQHLVNNITAISLDSHVKEESTGLHNSQFIETRRHWFDTKVTHFTHGNLNVVNLVEGAEVTVESPDNLFEPYVIHYAETFIVPAHVPAYTIKPSGKSAGMQCATLKAYVRP
ncbi:class I mannose-6-phosphate isomerase [Dyadobacter sediminis]|uniref:Mannose-6-phosphate isomerase n=1 Tax=Dyadobacter sediminis TaxID=1493691 RepID=A0A5R9KBC4_9BACT|nr:class I mannose-6-phosphate isomerase [Dyadobacter sediminis]TLU92106.1 mannose-6-phosphate isomerase [Dyadobacter sediminis]GGB97388.1 mannose-6-phosphate isomerase [Dyadobacter sediminis]